MERLAAALADRYRIERELGSGGMATVYLANDLRHDREVAIKLLHSDLGALLGSERFLTEIKTTARLQHPHILPLLDSGEAGGLLFYVMPYVRGETLRSRLERDRQLPIDEAIRIAREVADALGAAHGLGIIHRDIKPENILLQGGHALVADFGIALAVQQAGGNRMTQTGLSLGTPQYMSPEQAMGERSIGARSDIYALGAVTYEMLTGDPPFTGSTIQAIVAKVLSERPTPIRTLRETVPAHVEQAVLTALAKLPADRFGSAAEFAAALGGTGSALGSMAPAASAKTRPGRSRTTEMILGGIALVSLGLGVWGWTGRSGGTEFGVHRLEFTTTDDVALAFPILSSIAALTISPDGSSVVFSVRRGSGWALALRKTNQLSARVLPGTEGARYPEFSPDGRWIAFESGGTLKKITVDGSVVTTITSLGPAGSAGLTWISNEEIVYSLRAIGSYPGLMRVSAAGGAPTVLSQPDTAAHERFHLEPKAVAGGRVILYSSTRGNSLLLTVGAIETRTGRSVTFPELRGARPLGMIDNLLVYVRADGVLMAAPFDPGNLTAGAPIQVGDSVAVRNWDAAAAISESGTLIYQRGGSAGQLIRVTPEGRAAVLVDSVRPYHHPRYSPDGTRIAFGVAGGAGLDIWSVDLGSGALERITEDGGNDRPEWSADGTRVAYSSARDLPQTVWWRPADGSEGETRLQANPHSIREVVFSRDGDLLLFRVDHPTNSRDIWMRRLRGDTIPVPLLATIHDEKQPRPSPDSRWLAYVSNESGREEVYVRPLAPGGGRVPVSAGGGGEPLWGSDGTRIFYRAGDQVIEARIATAPALRVTDRRVLFQGDYATDAFHPNYDIAPDGKSFLMVRPVDLSRGLVMVVNWRRELRERTGR